MTPPRTVCLYSARGFFFSRRGGGGGGDNDYDDSNKTPDVGQQPQPKCRLFSFLFNFHVLPRAAKQMASGEKGVENGRIKESKGEQQPGRVSLARLHHRVQAPLQHKPPFRARRTSARPKCLRAGPSRSKFSCLSSCPGPFFRRDYGVIIFYLLFLCVF